MGDGSDSESNLSTEWQPKVRLQNKKDVLLAMIVLTVPFLNYCRSRINRIKQQKQQNLALPTSPTLDS